MINMQDFLIQIKSLFSTIYEFISDFFSKKSSDNPAETAGDENNESKLDVSANLDHSTSTELDIQGDQASVSLSGGGGIGGGGSEGFAKSEDANDLNSGP